MRYIRFLVLLPLLALGLLACDMTSAVISGQAPQPTKAVLTAATETLAAQPTTAPDVQATGSTMDTGVQCDGKEHEFPGETLAGKTGCLTLVEWDVSSLQGKTLVCGLSGYWDTMNITLPEAAKDSDVKGSFWYVYLNRWPSHLAEYLNSHLPICKIGPVPEAFVQTPVPTPAAQVVCDGIEHHLPTDKPQITQGCTLVIEAWVPNPEYCHLFLVNTSVPDFPPGVTGSWWNDSASQAEIHRGRYFSTTRPASCTLVRN